MYETYLVHHGILGQKWGVRRYQNADGTLTEAGKKKYDQDAIKEEKYDKKAKKFNQKARMAKSNKKANKYAIKADKYGEMRDKISWDKLSYQEQKDRKNLLNKGLNADYKATEHMLEASKYMKDKTKLSEFSKEYDKYESMMKKANKYYKEYEKKYGKLEWNYANFELKKDKINN